MVIGESDPMNAKRCLDKQDIEDRTDELPRRILKCDTKVIYTVYWPSHCSSPFVLTLYLLCCQTKGVDDHTVKVVAVGLSSSSPILL